MANSMRPESETFNCTRWAGSPRPSSSFAACFNPLNQTDVHLRVYTDTAAGCAEPTGRSDPGPAARSYHCHTITLASRSSYFKAQLSQLWQPPKKQQPWAAVYLHWLLPRLGGPDDAKQTVDIHVEAEELDALHELLQMMYSQALPAAPPGSPAYLQCLALADRLEALSCMEILIAGLDAALAADINPPFLSYVFEAPPGLCASCSYTALLESCTKALVRLFGDVPATVKDAALLQHFCSLPHAALLAWVKSDDLRVHSENCVVFILSAWVQANQHSTAAQLEELAHQIRVFHLGPAYLHHILPDLGWFKQCSNMEFLPAVLSCLRAGVKMTGGLEAERDKMYSDFEWPPGWCARPRKGSGSSRTGSWVLSSSQVEQAGDQGLVLPPVYVNGFLMRLLVQQGSAAAAPASKLGVYVSVDSAAMSSHGVPWPSKAVFRIGTVRAKVGSAGSQCSREAVLLRARLFAVDPTGVWGMANVLGAAAPTFLELLGPYMHEGQLHLSATFSAVDT